MKLKDKVAIVTGGGRGIGRAYALRFVDEGAKVVIADVIFENAQKVAEEIKGKGGDALAIHTDVSNENSTIEMAKKTAECFGRIDILVNNAAIYYGIGSRPWDGWTVEDWDRMFAVNVRGSWLCAKAVVPQMKDQGKGKIINIGSSSADAGLDQILAYICSKGAVATLSRGLARALGRYKINVNCILPGFTLSEASLEMSGKGSLDEVLIKRRCLRRAEYPEDLVGTAVFLASEDSDFVTGQVISVDGGDVMR